MGGRGGGEGKGVSNGKMANLQLPDPFPLASCPPLAKSTLCVGGGGGSLVGVGFIFTCSGNIHFPAILYVQRKIDESSVDLLRFCTHCKSAG